MRSLNFIVRLTEHCNLDCAYCYISREIRKNSRILCDIKKIERLYQLISNDHFRRVEFVWHGGEPLIFGKRNFKVILDKQDTHFHNKAIIVHNAIQTNGTIIDDDWAKVFKEYNIGVGISIDAPRDVHEKLRVHWSGRGSYNRILKSIALLKKYDIPISAISVLNKLNVSRIREIFDFFQQLEIPFKLNPISKEEDVNKSTVEQLSIPPKEYGLALTELFSYYINTKQLRTSVVDLRDIATSMFTGCNSNCLFAGKCEDFFGMAVNGDLYFCDLFHIQKFRLGNVLTTTLSQITDNDTMNQVKHRKDKLRGCNSCEWWDVCRGGCTTAAYNAYRDINREDYYCESRKIIFEFMKSNLIELGKATTLSNKPSTTYKIGVPNEKENNQSRSTKKQFEIYP